MPQESVAELRARLSSRPSIPTPTLRSRAWDTVSKPLTDAPSRAARVVSGGIRNLRKNMTNRTSAQLAGFIEGGIEGIGDVLTDMTSPLDIAATVTGLGAMKRAKKGYDALRSVEKLASLGQAARGGQNIYEGISEGDASKVGAGSIEAGLNLAGLGTLIPATKAIRAQKALDNIVPPKLSRPKAPPPVDLPSPSIEKHGIVRQTDRNVPRQDLGTFGIRPESNPAFASVPERMRAPSTNQVVFDALLPSRTRELIGVDKPRLTQELPDIKPSTTEPVVTPKVKKITTKADIKAAKAKVKAESKKSIVLKDPPVADAKLVAAKVATPNVATPSAPISVESNPSVRLAAQAAGIDVDTPGWFDRLKSAGQALKSEKGSAPMFTKGISDLGSKVSDLGSNLGSKIKGDISAFGQTVKNLKDINLINQSSKHVQKIKEPYQKWVNSRAARKGLSFNVKKDFADLSEGGMDLVHAYQAGDRSGRLADVQTHQDALYTVFDAARKKLGVKQTLGFKENYITQIWDNTPEEIAAALGKNKRLSLKPSIAMKSMLDTYKQGEALGLTPKYKSIPEIMGFYTEVLHKNIADLEFFNTMKAQGSVKKEGAKGTTGWTALSRDIFPAIKNKKGEIIHYAAPPEVHKILDNYLTQRSTFTQKILNGVQLTKDVALASGLPGTAFNAHGFNMLRRSSAVGGFKGFGKALGYMINPGVNEAAITGLGGKLNHVNKLIDQVAPWESAAARIERGRHLIPEILAEGGRLGVEGHTFNDQISSTLLGKSVDKLSNWHKDLFETHLFDKMIPALKMDYYEAALAAGVNKKEAARAMNLAFAGINYDELATNRRVLDIARGFLLAPDWYASNVGLSKNIVQSYMNSNHPGAKMYRKAGRGLLGMYVMGNAANYALTYNDDDGPKFMFQNESGRRWDIDTGAYTIDEEGKKKKVYVSQFGTAFDAYKLPGELMANIGAEIMGVEDNSMFEQSLRSIKNRTSLPVHAGVNFLSNTDDFGDKLVGEDRFGRDLTAGQELGNLTEHVFTKPLTPSYASAGLGYLKGRSGGAEALSNAIEAPLIFKSQETGGRGRRGRQRRRR